VTRVTAERISTPKRASRFSLAHTFAQSSYTRWSVSLFNTAGQLTATRAYHMRRPKISISTTQKHKS
jgi:hypothetical protein